MSAAFAAATFFALRRLRRKYEKTPIKAQPSTLPTTPTAMHAKLDFSVGDGVGVGVEEVTLPVEGRLLVGEVVMLVKWVVWKSVWSAGELQFVAML